MTKKAELVFIPMPGMGHLVSTVQLAKLLVDLNSNLSITVLTSKSPYDGKVSAYVDSLTAAASTTSRIKFINLPHPDPDADIFKFMSSLVQTQLPLVKEAVTNIVELSNSVPESPRLAGFVLDMFLTAFAELANEFGVPSYAFYTSGAAFLGFQFYTQVLNDEQNVDFVELKDPDTEFIIQSYINPVSIKLFPTEMFSPASITFLLNMARGLREMKGIMVNTFSELESHAVETLSNGKLQQIPPVYPVGPILDLTGSSQVHDNYDTIMQWLDEQPGSSVVFLCFGSKGSFSVDQVIEIANALQQSRHRFLWSLRRPGEQVKGKKGSPTDYENVEEVLPEGFLDRMAGIGMVIGWAPQVAILGHPAIGGFVSHCGWNSTLESIWLGVPMAAWPLYAEQRTNAFLLVEELGLAVEIKMDYKNYGDEVEIVKADKIENGIRRLMEQDSDVRKRMKEMSDKSRKALTNSGSSHSTLYRFIDDIINNIHK
ncbi:putative UDP-glucose flavonoid 3-O-glucosyltransferase 3 [Hibiscus syriacus]|uniref:Glycosyltransferase n=1 Tax=Hibiscus syriacus TaxID=106335 RepID=A0A6A2ZF05_HIBSY|nr:anthocyanidin 3-O-glucosyltransferase 6-like [Hibiscus syriacus]KAE8690110.1 putative UDP-glucose flavonoid 3-O-glucosyltransferase 3 [Hibiscus syriacus]